MTGASAAARAIFAARERGAEPVSLQELHGSAVHSLTTGCWRRSGAAPARWSRTRRPAATGSSARSTPAARCRGRGSSTCSPASAGAGQGAARTCRGRSRSPRPRRGAGGVRLDFLLEAVGPGTERLAGTRAGGDPLHLTGPLGRPFSAAAGLAPEAAGAILVGGGIGIAPLAILRRELADRGIPQRVLLGFRDREHSRRPGAVSLLGGAARVRGRPPGHQGYVTDLLAVLLEGDDAGSAAVYACGPPAMLEAVRALCAERGSPPSWRWRRRWPAASAPASAARSRSPAAATCASASTGRPSHAERIESALVAGSRALTDVSRPSSAESALASTRSSTAPGPSTRSPPGAPSARRVDAELPVQRLRLEDDHARAAGRQPAAAPVRDPGRDDQLDRAPEQGARGLPRRGPAAARPAARAADRLGDGDQPRGLRGPGRARRRPRRGRRRSSSTSPARTSSPG